MGQTARRLVHILDQMEVFGSSPQFNSRVRAWQGRSDAGQVSTATPSLGDGLACGAHRSQAMRPVDTLPGGLGSLKSFSTDRIKSTPRRGLLLVAFTEARSERVRACRAADSWVAFDTSPCPSPRGGKPPGAQSGNTVIATRPVSHVCSAATRPCLKNP